MDVGIQFKRNKRKRVRSQDGIISTAFIYSFVVFVMVITIYPFLNVVALSFNESLDTNMGINMIWPRSFTLENYRRLLTFDNLPIATVNSVLRTVIGTFVSIISCSLVAYTLSRRDYVFRKIIGIIFIIPIYVTGGIIPYFMLIRNLGLTNTFMVYIIPGLIHTWNVIIIRSFMDGLPFEIQESAMIDGANDLKIFWMVVFPLCKPVIATVCLWIAVGHWNSWVDTYLFNPGSPHLFTLQYELMKVLDSTNAGNASAIALRDPNAAAMMRMVSPLSTRMAITVVVIVPILMVYPFIQKYFVTGMTLGAVKS